MSEKKEIFIVPSTHWDREWYKPFQEFRYRLVGLIDQLLEILESKDYYFTFDGQTIILEDYFEIKPEMKDKVVKKILERKIAVGPWYLLPDEWLVGQESIIRNLETSFDLSKELGVEQMNVGYLPDQFGHTRAIPQILADLTNIKCAVIWRGVGPEIDKVPFYWKSNTNATTGIITNYLPYGYGNASSLAEELEALKEDIKLKIKELDEYSPFPIYLLMNGTDHTLPQKPLIDLVPKLNLKDTSAKISILEDYIDRLLEEIKKRNYQPKEYCGEFRSPLRAPLLQDTYSARIWIKQWDNKIEDLLIHYVEPINSILHLNKIQDYPKGFITTAWKWLLKNQPHDSICGCSVDQTHNEMIGRYLWAESIVETNLSEMKKVLELSLEQGNDSFCLAFNPSNNGLIPSLVEFQLPAKENITKIKTETGEEYPIQPLTVTEEVLFENTFKLFVAKTGLRMLSGRKLMDFYINEIEIVDDKIDPKLAHVTLVCDNKLVGELNIQQKKEEMVKIIDSGKYKKFHVKVTKGSKQSYSSILPLTPWKFNLLSISDEPIKKKSMNIFEVTKDSVVTDFYSLKFNNDGTLNLMDKTTETQYSNLHSFEDWGDRGDEYTFGRLGPNKVSIGKPKRKIENKGPLFTDIIQEYSLSTFYEISEERKKRMGRTTIPIKTTFRVYRDIPRIDITTTLTNTAKDHRLRICFDLPYKSEKTVTATHFGFIERNGNPIPLDEFAEMPSGIQAQKRFIRINEPNGSAAFTLFNKGLPEVELVENSKLALTLIRAVGYLSRQDYPERPMHAGPGVETPGAQELNKEYTFKYSLFTHHLTLPMNEIYNQAEAFVLPPKSYSFSKSKVNTAILEPLIVLPESMIKISSLRIRENKLLVLLYNLSNIELKSSIKIASKFNKCSSVRIDGTIKEKYTIKESTSEISFAPFELKLLQIE